MRSSLREPGCRRRHRDTAGGHQCASQHQDRRGGDAIQEGSADQAHREPHRRQAEDERQRTLRLFRADPRQSSHPILIEILDRDLACLAVRSDQEAHADPRLGRFRHRVVDEHVAIEGSEREALARRPEKQEERPPPESTTLASPT